MDEAVAETLHFNADRTIRLKLDLSEYDKETLRLTMSMSNHVFNEIAQYGFDNHTCSKVSIHHAAYYDIRKKYPELPCSILQGIRDVACEALKGIGLKKLPKSKQYSAIRYNKRVCNINLVKQTVTLASVKGRIKSTFPIPGYYSQYLGWELRTSTLSYNRQKDTFYLHVTIRKQSPSPEPPLDIFTIEDLTSIRVQSRTRGIEFATKLNNWSFYQLEQFLRYKAEAVGKTVVIIDPRYTSQKCSNCGHIYKGNRKGNSFHCVKCRFQIHADLNAARNIAQMGISQLSRHNVTVPYMTCNETQARKGIDVEHSYNAPHLSAG